MLVRTLATLGGVYLILLVLAERGFPVTVLIRGIPTAAAIIGALVILYAALSKD